MIRCLAASPVRSFLLLCFALWALQGCSNNPDTASETLGDPDLIEIEFREEFVIGDEGSSPAALLGQPAGIRTDSNGNIYVSDLQSPLVKVFDNQGEFLHTIGHEGGGPGEFRSTPVIEVSSRDELITLEGGNITRFAPSGERISSYIPEIGDMIWPSGSNYFRQIADGRFIIANKMAFYGENSTAEEEEIYANLLHLFDGELEERLTSFAEHRSLIPEDEFLQIFHRDHPGRLWHNGEKELWFTPTIYSGEIYRYMEEESGWVLSDTLRGRLYPEEPVITGERASGLEDSYVVVTYVSGMTTHYGRTNSESLGIFTLQDGRLVHFSNQFVDGERTIVLELFDTEGLLAGLGHFDLIDAETMTRSSIGALINPIWKDHEDRFYFSTAGELPVIRVGQFIF
ncbi:MAG: 6-bladed beta-propeller [Balneolaceae bacterium]